MEGQDSSASSRAWVAIEALTGGTELFSARWVPSVGSAAGWFARALARRIAAISSGHDRERAIRRPLRNDHLR
jgi:hypothetical protein